MLRATISRWELTTGTLSFHGLEKFLRAVTQGELKNSDDQVNHRSDFDELLGMSTTSIDFDVASVEGEAQLQVYMQVQQVPNDTDPVGCGGISISKSFPTWPEWLHST
jgi:hypothetical protein